MAQTPSLDHSTCLCKYCNPGAARTPRKDLNTEAINAPQKATKKMNAAPNPIANAAERPDNLTVTVSARQKTFPGSVHEPGMQLRRLSDLGIERQMHNGSQTNDHNALQSHVTTATSNLIVTSDESSEETVEGPLKIAPSVISRPKPISPENKRRGEDYEYNAPRKHAKTDPSAPQKIDEDGDLLWISSDSNSSTPKTIQQARKSVDTVPTPTRGSKLNPNVGSSANRETGPTIRSSANGAQSSAKHSTGRFPHNYQPPDSRVNIPVVHSANVASSTQQIPATAPKQKSNDNGARWNHSQPKHSGEHHITNQQGSSSSLGNPQNIAIVSNLKGGDFAASRQGSS
ncbi:hypothetical protein BJ742DRAFT_40979 [Cladochytrium replicatum]|nr:hypothetical protein BJ742DRAFT_40979 [Cladochytrium replicatum]